MATAQSAQIRNIALIAHVDHGKTTLVDAMLRQSGVFGAHQEVTDRVMDNIDLERERGITIMAKNTAVSYRGVKINICDTPGHADFGGEVERTLKMVDGVLLLVDASEGPQPQTRFVLRKAFEQGLDPIVVINKIDRPDSRIEEVLNEIYDLFIDLGAEDHQIEFPVVYAIAREGIAKVHLDDQGTNLQPLFDLIVDRIPPPKPDPTAPLQVLITSLDYDEYVGRLAVGRVFNGTLLGNTYVAHCHDEGVDKVKVGVIYTFSGLKRVQVDQVDSGDLVCIAGVDEVMIGDTISSLEDPRALPRVKVDEPTLSMIFGVNTSPLAGRDGKYVTSRQIRERLYKEIRVNVSIRVKETDREGWFVVEGRGELQLAILVEMMRREGYELEIGKPQVIIRDIDGVRHEPVERLSVDVPTDYVGAVTQALGTRKGIMDEMRPMGSDRVRLEFLIPSRGLIGFRNEFLNITRGTGIMAAIFHAWEPWKGEIETRLTGSLVSDRAGVTTPYALFNLQDRGELFVTSQVEVYEGMVIGEHAKESDLNVNCCREKKLTNVRAAGKDENVALSPPRALTLETCMEFIRDDELVEVTPKFLRLRKKVLAQNMRPVRRRADG